MGIRNDVLLGMGDAERKVVAGDGHDLSYKRLTYGYDRSKKLLRDAANLGTAFLCALLLLAAASFADLDSNFATSMPMTAAIRHALGLPRWGSAANNGTDGGTFILVAEKDNVQRLIAKTTLERCGYSVALTDDGSEAVALFRKAAPRVSLVLLDRAELRSSTGSVVRQFQEIRPDVRILVSQTGSEPLPSGVTRIAGPLSASALTETVRKVVRSN
jgi:CheY-like chemotaxis protein